MMHTFECHSSTPNFRYPCGISGCIHSDTFNTFSGMSSHLQRQHLHHLAQLETTGELPNPDAGDGIILSLHECNDQGIMDDTGEEIPLRGEEIPLRSSISCSHIMAKKSAALLLLTLKERHRLTQTAVNFSIGQIKQMLQYVFDDVKVSVSRKLNIDEVDIEDCFDIDLFEGLETKYLQTKFCNDHFNLVVGSCLMGGVHGAIIGT